MKVVDIAVATFFGLQITKSHPQSRQVSFAYQAVNCAAHISQIPFKSTQAHTGFPIWLFDSFIPLKLSVSFGRQAFRLR